ncbi:MAG: hypothetical protein IJX77_09265 [Ruminococcus sp.]|nr:hypothetical protein [Ruminococcus sp.]
MKKFTERLLAALCAVCIMTAVSCSDDKSEKESSFSEPAAGAVDADGNPEFVTNPDEPDLGEYTVSAGGIKLYYDPDDVSAEIMALLEKYFVAYSQSDYETYTECVYPDYITKMSEYLEKDFGYGLEQSFETQCENLRTNAGGDFTVTRIKTELPEESGMDDFFASLDEVFGEGFYDSVKADSDALYDVMFYVMAEANGEETLLISEFEIVFAEKDGKFYTFG